VLCFSDAKASTDAAADADADADASADEGDSAPSAFDLSDDDEEKTASGGCDGDC